MPIVYTPPAPPGLRPFPLGQGSYNGIGWGPGQQIQVVDHKGLDETPSVNPNDQRRDQAHGTWSGGEWMAGRTVSMTLAVIGQDNDDLRSLLALIELAWWPDGVDRPLWLFDSHRFLSARLRRRAFDQLVGGRERVSRIAVEWYGPDPFYHGPQVTAALPATVSNDGLPTPVVLRVVGPAVAPIFTLGASPVQWNATLASGHVLELDSNLRTAKLDGVGGQALTPTSHWWSLQPGSNVVSYAGGGTPTLVYSPRWA